MMDAMPRVTALDPDLLTILACPACRSSLTVNTSTGELSCTGCRRNYPVRDGVPILLVDHARMSIQAVNETDV